MSTAAPASPPSRTSRLRKVWLKLYRSIDRRVAVDGDSETRRFQKVLVVCVAIVGSIATLFNASTLFQGGLEAAGWWYIASAIYLMAGGIAVLLWPRAYVGVTFVLLLDVLIFPAAAQVASGGLTSGLLAIPWAIFAPLGAGLALSGRHAMAQLLLFIVTIAAVAALDTFAQGVAPEVTSSALASFNIPSLLSLGVIAGATSLYLIRQMDRFRMEADNLLLNVLPLSIASRLKAAETTIADRYEDVTVLFADIVGFTPLSSGSDPDEIVKMLNAVFSAFDDIAREFGIEKIKTIGDSYMAAAGLPEPRDDHAAAMVDFGSRMLAAVDSQSGLQGERLRLRIGINSGPVVAGVIGHDRFIYDLWGDTVNVASRMESTGVTGRIQVTEAVVARVEGRYRFEAREPVDVKGKGRIVTYLLETSPEFP